MKMGTLEQCEELLQCFLNQEDFDKAENGKIWRGTYRNNYLIFDDEVIVQLTRGYFMICDLDDWENYKELCWHCEAAGYALTVQYVDKQAKNTFRFHSLIYGKPDVDHINNNRLDNRKMNLRHIG